MPAGKEIKEMTEGGGRGRESSIISSTLLPAEKENWWWSLSPRGGLRQWPHQIVTKASGGDKNMGRHSITIAIPAVATKIQKEEMQWLQAHSLAVRCLPHIVIQTLL